MGVLCLFLPSPSELLAEREESRLVEGSPASVASATVNENTNKVALALCRSEDQQYASS